MLAAYETQRQRWSIEREDPTALARDPGSGPRRDAGRTSAELVADAVRLVGVR